jgi:hypothetical protein
MPKSIDLGAEDWVISKKNTQSSALLRLASTG